MIRPSDLIIFSGILIILIRVMFMLITVGPEKKEKEKTITFSRLKIMVRDRLNSCISLSEAEQGLFKKQRDNELKSNRRIANAIRKCTSGDRGASETVKSVISDYLNYELKLSDDEVLRLVDTDSSITKFTALIKHIEKSGTDNAFGYLWHEFFSEKAEKGSLTCEDLGEACEKFRVPDDADFKREILTELLYIYIAGLGAVDILNSQSGCIEEIQIGLSGTVKECYDYEEELRLIENGGKRDRKSSDSIHIIVNGQTVYMGFLTFGSEEEMIRVIKNLIKDTVAPELTKKNPKIVTDTVDGRRITVSRPPFSDGWAGIIRKFDTVKRTKLEELFPKEVTKIIRDAVKRAGSIAITGDMATGKTTLLRALLLETGDGKNLRIVEADSFELNIREYLPNVNVLTLRSSDHITPEDTLEFSKKTTGQVYVVGEVNSHKMALLVMEAAKTASKILFTAHYKTTEDMVTDFFYAAHGHTDEETARKDAYSALGIDIHLSVKNGVRFIERISEVTENGKVRCVYSAEKQNPECA